MTQQEQLTTSTTASTSTQTGVDANIFELSNHDMHITYMTSSVVGHAQLNYRTTANILSLQAQDIRLEKSELGTLVTVSTLKSVDMGYTSLTLVLPHVNLAGSRQQNINAVAIVTTHLFGVLPHAGAQQLYSIHNLQGTARFVEF